MYPTLIFDYDGTIHDTMRIYEPAFRRTFDWLTEEGYTDYQDIPSERIAGWLGLNSRVMWNTFLPELPQEIKEEASCRVGEGMIRRIENHEAKWYAGAEEILDTLKGRGYRMLLLSNCKIAYREANRKEFGTERWFERFYDCESYGFAPKTEIIKSVARDYPGPYVVIGDRRSDMELAEACKSPFIGCRYGFGEKGELDDADRIADSVTDIMKLL